MTDERAIPPAGRIGETEDLIGSVFVKDGKVCHSPVEREAKKDEPGRRGASVDGERRADDRWSQIHMMPNPRTDLLRVMVL